MTDYTDMIEELREPMHVTMEDGCPELDAYDEQRAKAADRIEELEAKLAKVTAAYRIEAMWRDDYTHDAFDKHIAELTGGKDE